ncbi:MAG: hypothetical protein V2I26_08835 [Halieaceae bacterium]|jgi:hypothetical protein|nr:hypothetical protein [Halieaceae bacterium]
MKNVIIISLVATLAGCTQARYRSHECDSLYYGRYQALAEPKALAFAIPAADPQTAAEYDTRCWARAAAGSLPQGMEFEEAMSVVVAGVLSDCNAYIKENNSLAKAHELDCRIAAKNMVWEPWVSELRLADARARGDQPASAQVYAAAGATAAAAPATAVVSPAAYAGAVPGPLRFHDEFQWCSAPGDACSESHFVEITNPGTGRALGRLAITIRPQDSLDYRLNYTVQFSNESQCRLVIEGNSIMQGGKTLGAWILESNDFAPAQMQSTSEAITFPMGASDATSISVSGRVEDCRS